MNRHILCIVLIFTINFSIAQEKPIGTIGFYNLENLFDTVDDPDIEDEEYLAAGDRQWTEERYQNKLNNMSRVIADMANGPDIVGLCEIENRKVLEDLVQTEKLKLKRYQIIHFNSPDHRGIDVGLIYKQGLFTPFDVRTIKFNDPNDSWFKTRDILWVKGLYHKDTLHVVVNHWPSRRGGKEDKRIIAAEILRKSIDSVQAINPEAKIVLMGDFNDDPSNRSIKKVLMADDKEKKLEKGMMYNAAGDTFKQGYGTLFYRGTWNLFDQIIISQSLLKDNATNYHYIPNSFRVFAADYMQEPKGDNKGAPLRTFSYGVYKNGYSDHYPSIIFIGRQ